MSEINNIDELSKKKAYGLFDSIILQTVEPGNIKCLQTDTYLPVWRTL